MASGKRQTLAVGSTVAQRYRIEARIAGGGMGAVYKATHLVTHRPVALKVMHTELMADASLRERFEREARVTARIQSDHLVQVLDAGVDDATSTPFLVMELLDGDDLATTIHRQGTLAPTQAVMYLRQAALALDRLHAEGVVHRDLKPDNMFLTHRDDGSPCVKLIDFGIAKQSSQDTIARTTQAGGTPLYMSPEQMLGDGTIDFRADIYALAHVAYELLVGQPYFIVEAEKMGAYQLMRTILQGAPESASRRARLYDKELHAAFDAWFARSTAADRAQRFDSVREQIADLDRLLSDGQPLSRLVDPYDPTLDDEALDSTDQAELVFSDPAPEPVVPAHALATQPSDPGLSSLGRLGPKVERATEPSRSDAALLRGASPARSAGATVLMPTATVAAPPGQANAWPWLIAAGLAVMACVTGAVFWLQTKDAHDAPTPGASEPSADVPARVPSAAPEPTPATTATQATTAASSTSLPTSVATSTPTPPRPRPVAATPPPPATAPPSAAPVPAPKPNVMDVR
jgi:eukaryotic-like serine/threonine-protein kinase